MSIKGAIARITDLDDAQRSRMLELMQRYYENVEPAAFHADLAAKTWVILLREGETLEGFSTQQLFEHEVGGRRVLVLFSGDTIIDKRCWGSFALPLTWSRLALQIEAEHPGRDLYWLLTTKGYKTYRFLPVFFEEFYPRCERETPPFERRLAESLAVARFPERRFDPQSWVLAAASAGQRLRSGVAELAASRLRDQHIAFFLKQNPGHASGDELVCICRCNEWNIKPFIMRRVKLQ